MLTALGVLKDILGFVVAYVDNNCAGKVRQDSILLQLVAHDWGIGFTSGTNSKSLLTIANSVV